jgi:hypothetical protein
LTTKAVDNLSSLTWGNCCLSSLVSSLPIWLCCWGWGSSRGPPAVLLLLQLQNVLLPCLLQAADDHPGPCCTGCCSSTSPPGPTAATRTQVSGRQVQQEMLHDTGSSSIT